MASVARVVAWLVAVFWIASGAWAFFAPQSFFDTVATYPPYNVHFIHDIGSFMIGLGAVIVLALAGYGGLRGTLLGVGVGSAFHLVSHVIDYDIKPDPQDVVGQVVITAAIFFAAFATRR